MSSYQRDQNQIHDMYARSKHELKAFIHLPMMMIFVLATVSCFSSNQEAVWSKEEFIWIADNCI